MSDHEADPDQVLEVLRGALLEYLDTDEFGPWYRPQTAILVGKYSGTSASAEPAIHGEPEPLVLLLTMRDGKEYRLTLEAASI